MDGYCVCECVDWNCTLVIKKEIYDQLSHDDFGNIRHKDCRDKTGRAIATCENAVLWDVRPIDNSNQA